MPRSLFRFVWKTSGWHQFSLVVMSLMVLAADVAPLEIQRRIINDAFSNGALSSILGLVALYISVTLAEGLLKFGLNLYRSWLGEWATRWLRLAVFGSREGNQAHDLTCNVEGVQLSIVLDEAEPVGGFVGQAVSEPLLQAGVLISVTGYMLYVQPMMALIMVFVFIPQFVFVPIMQAAINRRISDRVLLLRAVSTGIVTEGGAYDRDGNQTGRVNRVFSTNMAIYRLKFGMNFLMNLATHGGVAAILALGGYLVVGGQTEIGTIVVFLSGLAKINDPWGELVTWYRDMCAARVKYQLIYTASTLGVINGRTGATAPAYPLRRRQVHRSAGTASAE
ncbi:ABC-type multidrug transport system fused ATPase/permease subunit [Ancylobacter sp. 3268]|uniref:ABC transporter transmembrane domain-containing protein n=1 Tax=Ancylobacter sp. 3268 TaxID=2817752 RepID=UPI0028670400|nr:ABC transporter transmembrane domain-containing protein [Ancylobacter sp. 3268]MDR6951194.1 ABC-type multidrug transport system fused ATPase/permease subunit [Ancylobacter sp. 3268]